MTALAALLLLASPHGDSAPRHRFELVSVTQDDATPDGAVRGGEPCLFGRHAPGQRVLLLSDFDSSTCSATTGAVGENLAGACTVLVGAKTCTGQHLLGALGARGAYRRLAARPVTDDAALRAIWEAVRKDGAVEKATARWPDVLRDALSDDGALADAVTSPDMPGSPTFARLRARGGAVDGPWVTVWKGEVGTMIGPIGMPGIFGFVLDGRSYVHLMFADCDSCGAVGSEVDAVEGGKLRQVLVSFGNSD